MAIRARPHRAAPPSTRLRGGAARPGTTPAKRQRRLQETGRDRARAAVQGSAAALPSAAAGADDCRATWRQAGVKARTDTLLYRAGNTCAQPAPCHRHSPEIAAARARMTAIGLVLTRETYGRFHGQSDAITARVHDEIDRGAWPVRRY